MSVTVRNLIPFKFIENAQTTQYTVPAATRTVIDKCLITNVSAGSETFTLYIPLEGTAAGNVNLVYEAKAVGAGASFQCPELVGLVLPAGSYISAEASAADSLNINMAGREIT